jgi:hypothetical protein
MKIASTYRMVVACEQGRFHLFGQEQVAVAILK